MQIINPARKLDWKVCKQCTAREFGSVGELKDNVHETLQDAVENPLVTIGYIEPGHEMRGTQQSLTLHEDLRDIYDTLTGKNKIILRCYSPLPSSAVIGKCPHSELQWTLSPD